MSIKSPPTTSTLNSTKLEASKCYLPSGAIGGAGIVAKPARELPRLQANNIAAVAPFTVDTGTMVVFTASHNDSAMGAQMTAYVSRSTGDHFSPHGVFGPNSHASGGAAG